MNIQQGKVLLFTLTLLVLSCNKDNVRLIGTIDNHSNSVVKLYETRIFSNKLIDSAVVRSNGTFRISNHIKNFGFYYLGIDDSVGYDLLLAPGDKIKVQLDAKAPYSSIHIEGSPETVKLQELNQALLATRYKIDSLQVLYDLADTDYKHELELAYGDIIKAHKRYLTHVILTNLHSLVSVSALYQEITPGVYLFNTKRDLQFFKLVSDSLNKAYPNQRQVKALQENFAQLMSDFRQDQLLNMLPKKEVISIPEIKLPDSKGQIQSLLAIKKPYVLLLFWSSANPASMDLNPGFKKVYDRFKSKGLEIYAVSIDQNLHQWQRAVKFEELEWMNVCDTAFVNSSTQILYNVRQIPSNYLIDTKQQEIISSQLSPAKLSSLLEDVLN